MHTRSFETSFPYLGQKRNKNADEIPDFEPDIEPNIKPDRADLGIRFYDILIQDVSITKTPWTGKHRKIRPCI